MALSDLRLVLGDVRRGRPDLIQNREKTLADLRVDEVERILPAHHAGGGRRREVRRAHQRRGIAEAAEQFPPRPQAFLGDMASAALSRPDLGFAVFNKNFHSSA